MNAESLPEKPTPTLVYSMLGVAGLWLLTRLPLFAIAGGLLRFLLALVRPTLIALGSIHLWEQLQRQAEPVEASAPDATTEDQPAEEYIPSEAQP